MAEIASEDVTSPSPLPDVRHSQVQVLSTSMTIHELSIERSSIVDYLKYARDTNEHFPGFESDVHGLRFEPAPGGERRWMVDCIRE